MGKALHAIWLIRVRDGGNSASVGFNLASLIARSQTHSRSLSPWRSAFRRSILVRSSLENAYPVGSEYS